MSSYFFRKIIIDLIVITNTLPALEMKSATRIAIETDGANASWLSVVQQQVESLSFGVVQIVVHNERVVQIERTEKIRLDRPNPKQT
jgi:hypothetical protein